MTPLDLLQSFTRYRWREPGTNLTHELRLEPRRLVSPDTASASMRTRCGVRPGVVNADDLNRGPVDCAPCLAALTLDELEDWIDAPAAEPAAAR